MKIKIPYFKQEKSTTCGVACLRMVVSLNGLSLPEVEIEDICDTSWLGNTCEEIARGAQKLNYDTEIIENIDIDALKGFLNDQQPIIALIDPAVIYGGIQGFGHFVVVIGYDENWLYYHDPDLKGDLKIESHKFFEAWSKRSCKGIKVWKYTKK